MAHRSGKSLLNFILHKHIQSNCNRFIVLINFSFYFNFKTENLNHKIYDMKLCKNIDKLDY